MENYNHNKPDIFTLEVDEYGKATFLEMTRWTKFLAILGFVMIGLMLLFGVGMAMMASTFSQMSTNPMGNIGGVGIFIVVLFAIGVYFYPIYALLKYSSGMKLAMQTNSKEQFNSAIMYLKNMFKYIGILMIIFLCLYAVLIVFAILGAALASR